MLLIAQLFIEKGLSAMQRYLRLFLSRKINMFHNSS